MTGTSAAVFLSYASQDAEAARRICDTLRARDIEVWFDQSELRGGDAWDRKIRGQIRDCALFVPLISANTASRLEGYFRLEWKLAVDRTHLMAAERAFLLPVTIDAIDETKAFVPDEFRHVQWTRAPGGRVPPGFDQRVASLLSQYAAGAAAPGRAVAAPVETPDFTNPAAPAAPPVSAAAKPWRRATVIAAGVVAVAVALFFAGRLTHTPLAPPQAFDAMPSAARPSAGGASAPDKSIAVLPFADLSEKKDQEYFSDGLTEEIMDQLAKVAGLHVIARTSSFAFKDKSDDIPTIAKKLNVANLLEGSVRKSGDHLRVTTQLVRGKDGENFWSETYDRELKDVFQVQDEITTAVVSALKVSLMGSVPRAIPTANTEAFTTFLKCMEAGRIETRESTLEAEKLCRRSTELDASYAPAWGWLGDCYRAEYVAFGNGDYQDIRRKAYDALQKAISLAPQSAGPHRALANLYYQMDFDVAAALRELRLADALEPPNADSYWTTGYIADTDGRFEESLSNLYRAIQLDPLAIDNYIQIGNTLYRAGRLPEALDAFQRALALQPTVGSVHYRLALVHLRRGDAAKALTEMQQEPDSDFHALGLPMALYALGRREDADEALAKALTVASPGSAYQVALAYASRHDTELTLKWLERSYEVRDAGLLWLKADPFLEFVRNEPRYKALLAKMHF